MAKNLENAEKITYNELRAWMTGLIRGKRGAIPDLEDWKQIKIMMDKVQPEVVTIPALNHSDVYGPIVTQPNYPNYPYDPYSPWCDSPTVVRNPFGGFTNEDLKTTGTLTDLPTSDQYGTIGTSVSDTCSSTSAVMNSALTDGYEAIKPSHDIHNHSVDTLFKGLLNTKDIPLMISDANKISDSMHRGIKIKPTKTRDELSAVIDNLIAVVKGDKTEGE